MSSLPTPIPLFLGFQLVGLTLLKFALVMKKGPTAPIPQAAKFSLHFLSFESIAVSQFHQYDPVRRRGGASAGETEILS